MYVFNYLLRELHSRLTAKSESCHNTIKFGKSVKVTSPEHLEGVLDGGMRLSGYVGLHVVLHNDGTEYQTMQDRETAVFVDCRYRNTMWQCLGFRHS